MKRYIKSFTTDELKSALGDKYPKGGYLYIFKHGIGPGTIPDDVKVVKVKDLPNYYTAVWLDRFLTTPELKQYDIPDETRITELLNRIGYCQKNGDVVPCDDVEACGDINCSTRVTASNYDTKLIAKWLKAKFDDEAFGTAYTMHRISDADAYMGRNGLTYNRRNNTIDLWKSGGEEDIPVYKVVPQYSSTKKQGTYAPKLPKLIPIDEWNATHNIGGSTKPRYMANMVSASIDEDGFEQLIDTDEDDSTWEEPKYIARSYYGTNYSGLEDDFSTDDPSELIDWIWEHASRGGYIEVEGPKDRIRLDPDVLAENVEFGDIGEYEIMSQIDYL